MKHFPLITALLTFVKKDNYWWAVWVGRHAPENQTGAPKGWLRRVRNPPWSVRAKANLTVFWSTRDADAKAWSNEPPSPLLMRAGDKREVTPGITELSSVRVHIDPRVCYFDVVCSYPGAA